MPRPILQNRNNRSQPPKFIIQKHETVRTRSISRKKDEEKPIIPLSGKGKTSNSNIKFIRDISQ